MTLTNCYGTLANVKTELKITDNSDDTRLEDAGNAAARDIDAHTGWKHGFWQDASTVDRKFYADDSRCCYIPEGISTVTGLVVKSDSNDDGTFATTLTINTNFILTPVNAALEYPIEPYTSIELVDYTGSYFQRSGSGRPGVQVTAKFGWPAVPSNVYKAWISQTIYLFKSSDAVFGAIQLGEGGFATRIGKLNPTAEALLESVSRPRIG